MEVRYSTHKDLDGIVEIINYYNANSVATLDSKQYSSEEKLKWFNQFDDSSPYKLVVAAIDNQIVGYASSIVFRDKDVFGKTIETSVYVHPKHGRKGIGSKLYSFLFKELFDCDLHRVVVGIALPNDSSISLHEKFGFKVIGIFDEYAYFKDQFISSVWMQKEMNSEI